MRVLIARLCSCLLLALCRPAVANDFTDGLVQAALARTEKTVRYDGSYRAIPYPNGDVPLDTGVCTDVVIRSYRTLGLDLQRLVHEDMVANFPSYPSKRIWDMSRPDTNIDHRRVPNLRVFFARNGDELPISSVAEDYLPGDIVTWVLPGHLPHIGIVTNILSKAKRRMLVHNIGRGPELEDILFAYPITGHYRYNPEK